MTTPNTKPENAVVIEDLTVSESETANVKGGAAVDFLLVVDGVKGESDDTRR